MIPNREHEAIDEAYRRMDTAEGRIVMDDLAREVNGGELSGKTAAEALCFVMARVARARKAPEVS